jgi:hypothetical protein
VTVYLLTAAQPKGEPGLLFVIVVFYAYLAWLLFTSGGRRD